MSIQSLRLEVLPGPNKNTYKFIGSLTVNGNTRRSLRLGFKAPKNFLKVLPKYSNELFASQCVQLVDRHKPKSPVMMLSFCGIKTHRKGRPNASNMAVLIMGAEEPTFAKVMFGRTVLSVPLLPDGEKFYGVYSSSR